MKTEHALERLYEHQQGVLDHLARTLELARCEPEEVRGALAKSRLEMFRLLRAYQLFKHNEIFDPVIRRGNLAQIATATRMKSDCTAAGDAYRAYVNLWASCDVVAVWSSYRPALLAMAQRLRTHIEVERTQVPQLLAGAESTRRLTPALPPRLGVAHA